MLRKIIFFAFLLSLPFIEQVQAFFSDTAVSLSNKIIAGCWSNPSQPALLYPENGYAVNLESVSFSWEQANSTCPGAQIEYKFQIYSDSELANLFSESGWQGETSYNLDGLAEGEYWWRVKAKDQYLGSQNSQNFYLIVDQTVPQSGLFAASSPKRAIKENISAIAWESFGDAGISDNGTIRIGNPTYPEDEGKYYWQNQLYQNIGNDVRTLFFRYNLQSEDNSPSDSPAFLARINGRAILELSADSANQGWKEFSYDLSGFSSDNLSLVFMAGNSDDLIRQSWVDIDSVTTNLAYVQSSAQFTIEGEDNLSGIDFFEYKTASAQNFIKGSAFNIASLGSYAVFYRAVDKAGNVEAANEKSVVIDDDLPDPVSDEIELIPFGDSIDYQDLVINEISNNYIELRNLTDSDILLEGIYMAWFNGESEVDSGVDFSGKSILAGGFYVIENLNVPIENLQVRIYDSDNNLIDAAGDGERIFLGYFDDDKGKYYSMQRVLTPVDGTDPLDWFTCYYPTNLDIRGTPGSINR